MFKALLALATSVVGLKIVKNEQKYLDHIIAIREAVENEEKKTYPDDDIISRNKFKLVRLTRDLCRTIGAKDS